MLIIVLGLRWSMRTCVDQIMALPHIAGPRIRKESEYLSQQLETLRLNGTISNEAFLDAGAIQGAFELLGTLVEMGVSQKEIIQELKNTLDRAKRLEEKHPGLDFAVESGRAS
ncbi:MAG: hypothetical protein VXY35_06445 [Candidatus Thermoplasmatota archaeon]|nr:hypothetical protein [Candidatus Thermoplasmatota archaeon]